MLNNRNSLYLLLIVVALTNQFACSPKFYPEITTREIMQNVSHLASTELNGRKPGYPGDLLAATFIRNKFAQTKMQLLADNGFQPFSLITSVELGPSNHLIVNGKPLDVKSNFLPYSFSANTQFNGGIAFAGYGFDIKQDTLEWNDFGQIDLTSKWVIILKGDPEVEKNVSGFEEYSNERSKVLNASMHKAGGVLMVGGPKYSETDKLQGMFYDKNSSNSPIPVFQITREVADWLLSPANTSVAKMEEQLNDSRKPASFLIGGTIDGKTDVVQQQAETQNILAMVPGNDPVLKNEYIVIGAHYDHLGLGGPGSGSRTPDTVAIHFGADDNASGVAAVIELAEKAAVYKKNKRSLIFAAFGAEEMGLIGSKTFTDSSPIPIGKVVTMFNFDMIGRLDSISNALSVSGTQTSKEAEDMLNKLNQGFTLAFSGDGYGPSDHAAFYMQNIPVFYFSTGAHPDYHTPGDVAEKINFQGIKNITEYAWKLVEEVANRENALTYQEAGAKVKRSRGGRFKVTLGVMPDFAGMEKRGMRIDAIVKDGHADRGGLLKGDIITAIDGKSVGNIYDYMARLQTLEEGKTISVDIIRDGKEMVLLVQL